MEHEKYIVISGKHSKDYYPNNHPSHFHILKIHMNVLSWILPAQQPSLKLQLKCIHILQYDIRTTDRWQHRQSDET